MVETKKLFKEEELTQLKEVIKNINAALEKYNPPPSVVVTDLESVDKIIEKSNDKRFVFYPPSYNTKYEKICGETTMEYFHKLMDVYELPEEDKEIAIKKIEKEMFEVAKERGLIEATEFRKMVALHLKLKYWKPLLKELPETLEKTDIRYIIEMLRLAERNNFKVNNRIFNKLKAVLDV